MTSIHGIALGTLVLGMIAPAITHAQQQQLDFSDIPWQRGPTTGQLGKEAQIAVPDSCVFTGEDGVQLFNELTQNLANPGERGVIVCGTGWFVFFTYDDIGHVNDGERNALDADAILAGLQKGNERANKERRRRGWPTLATDGWLSAPHYDTATNNLTWASILQSSDGEQTVNHSVRFLGRSGVMDVDLVVGPEDIAAVLPTFNRLMEGFAFVPGQRYAEWRRGERVAEYGLTGLILGGAAVAAAKSGLLARLWKVIVAAVAAGAGALKAMFRRKKPAEAPART